MSSPSSSRFFRFGVFQLDLRARELRRNGIKVRVPDQSIQVLAMLLAEPGEVVTREAVHNKLWPNGTIVEFDHSINAAIKRLRQALEDSAESPRYVETLPRMGYRFIGAVENVAADEVISSATPSETSGERAGEVASHYRIVEKIGDGAMGVVYKAEDTRLGRTVALKFLPEEFLDDPAALARFQREGRSASALNHPNICTLYDIGETDGHPFLAMEFLEGETLLELMARGPVPVSQILELGTQIADALDAAHAKGIVHRDIKPSNIFVTARGSAKVMDFGLAKQPGAAEMGTNPPGAAVGTVNYMSPEQSRGEQLDTRSDLFSFGVVLYEMATGQRPFQGETTAVVFDAILNNAPIPLMQLRRDLPTGLDLVIKKTLEKDRHVRYQTAAELRADLKRIDHNSASATPVAGPAKSKLGRLRRTLVALALILAAGAGIAWYVTNRPHAIPQLNQRKLTSNPEDLPVDNAAVSPDGKYLGYSDQNGIHVQVLGSREVQTMPWPSDFQRGQDFWGFLGWFPESTRFLASLGVAGQGSSLWAVPILGGAPQKLVEGTEDAAVSPDGLSIAYLTGEHSSTRREIWLMGPQGESPHRILTAGKESGFVQVKWSPAGNRIVYQYFDPKGQSVESCDLQGANRVKMLADNPYIAINWIAPGRLIFSRWGVSNSVLSANLWDMKVEPKTGKPLGKPQRITDWSGFGVWRLSGTADGKHLAFLRGTYHQPVYLADLAGNGNRLLNARRLTADEYVNMPFGWTADSREVIFTSNHAGTRGIYKQALDGSAAQVISASLSLDVVDLRPSPDRASVIFAASPPNPPAGAPYQLYRVSVSGGPVQPLFPVQGFDDLNCSGKVANLCAYSAARGDHRELVITAFNPTAGPGKELLRIPIEPAGFHAWALSPDGTVVAFSEWGLDANRVLLIPLAGGPTRKVEVKGYFRLSSLEWAPDSKSFFMGSDGTNGATLLHIDLNGVVQPIWQQSHRGATGGSPSPDGKHIAIGGSTFNTNVWMVENF